MATAEERELLDDELQREVAAALRGANIVDVGVAEPEDFAGLLIDELRKRRIVLYRRAVHQLPPGLHQTTIEELAQEVPGMTETETGGGSTAKGPAAQVREQPHEESEDSTRGEHTRSESLRDHFDFYLDEPEGVTEAIESDRGQF